MTPSTSAVPSHHHRPEVAPEMSAAAALHAEQREKNHRGRDDHRFQTWRRDAEAFERAENADRWRDHPVAEQQRSTINTKTIVVPRTPGARSRRLCGTRPATQ